jgi:hypothetical protein
MQQQQQQQHFRGQPQRHQYMPEHEPTQSDQSTGESSHQSTVHHAFTNDLTQGKTSKQQSTATDMILESFPNMAAFADVMCVEQPAAGPADTARLLQHEQPSCAMSHNKYDSYLPHESHPASSI